MNSAEERILIPFNRTKLALNLFLCGICLAFFAFAVLGAPGWYLRFLALIGLAVFGSLTLYTLVHLVRRSPAMVLDQQGITDDTGNVFLGATPWSEIGEARVLDKPVTVRSVVIRRPQYVVIDVRRSATAAPRRNWFQRMGRKTNGWIVGGEIMLNVSNLGVTAEELAATINRCAARYRPALPGAGAVRNSDQGLDEHRATHGD